MLFLISDQLSISGLCPRSVTRIFSLNIVLISVVYTVIHSIVLVVVYSSSVNLFTEVLENSTPAGSKTQNDMRDPILGETPNYIPIWISPSLASSSNMTEP